MVQFRRALVPFALVLVAIHGGLLVIEWAIRRARGPADLTPADLTEILNRVLLVVCVGLAFPFGAATFSREFKEDHFLFLHSLPLSRGAMWGVLVGANFFAALCSLALLVAFRPSLYATLAELPHNVDVVSVGLSIFSVLFAAGCCLSLAFRRDLLVYLLGFFLVALLLLELSFMALFCGSHPRAWMPVSGNYHPGFWLTANLLAFLCFLLLSWRFFASGEFTLIKVQIRNSALVFLSAAGLVLALAVGQSFGLFSRFDAWVGDAVAVSSDGRYVSIFGWREKHPQFGRMRILDAHTGSLVQGLEQTGTARVAWSSQGPVLNLLVRGGWPSHPLGYLFPASDYLVRVSPESKQRETTRFPFSGIINTESLDDGRLLLVVRKNDLGRIVSLEPVTKRVTELGQGDMAEMAPWGYDFLPARDGVFVCFYNPRQPTTLWHVGGSSRQILWASPAGRGRPACIVHAVAYASLDGCLKKLNQLYPVPEGRPKVPNPPDAGGYVLQPLLQVDPFLQVDEATWMFYLRADTQRRVGTLFVWNRQKGGWSAVAKEIALSKAQIGGGAPGLLLNPRFGDVLVDSRDGLAIFHVRMQNQFRLFLYDAGIDRLMELGNVEKREEAEPSPWTRRVRGTKGVLVFLGPTRSPLIFKYQPGSGIVTPVKGLTRLRPWDLLFIDDAGNQIFASGEPRKIIRRTADGQENQLWPPPMQ